MLQYRLDIYRTKLSAEMSSTVFINEIDISFDGSINDVDPKTGGDVSCHDPDDATRVAPYNPSQVLLRQRKWVGAAKPSFKQIGI